MAGGLVRENIEVLRRSKASFNGPYQSTDLSTELSLEWMLSHQNSSTGQAPVARAVVNVANLHLPYNNHFWLTVIRGPAPSTLIQSGLILFIAVPRQARDRHSVSRTARSSKYPCQALRS